MVCKVDRKTAEPRSLAWAFLLYPESMKEWTYDYLKTCGLPIYVSPLHDRDFYTIDSEEVDDVSILAFASSIANYSLCPSSSGSLIG